MNASSKQPALTNKQWLRRAEQALSEAGIGSARLDAELLLADALNKDRMWLIAHADENIPTEELASLKARLARRSNHEPLAYIRGYKEFYGRKFKVTPDTLIPRPETEMLIELLAPLSKHVTRLVDVGTGSGAIAITITLEYPSITVEACDISEQALQVARANAKGLAATIRFFKSNLLEQADDTYDVICANLPYVDRSWEVSDETHSEPDLALYADDSGLELIMKLIEEATTRLNPNGYLLLEADPRQHASIIDFGESHGFKHHKTEGFIVVLQKD